MTTGPAERFAFCTYLVPGRELDYERFHRAIPADLDRAMRAAGVLSWRIHRDGTTLTHIVEARGRDRMRAQLSTDPANLHWQQQVASFLAPRAANVEPQAPPVSGVLGALVWDMSWPTR